MTARPDPITALARRGRAAAPKTAFPALAAWVLAAVLAPSLPARAQGIEGPDTGAGCMALGNGPTVVPASCQYIAPDDSQNVIGAVVSAGTDVVGSPLKPWRIFVVRCCSKASPAECSPVLGEDGGPPEPLAFNCLEPVGADGKPLNAPRTIALHESDGADVTTVHPIPGELVTVFLGSSRLGFVSVGQDEAFVPGGLPLP